MTFGKDCRIFLLKSGNVYGTGNNKRKHFEDNTNSHVDNIHESEISFPDKKDKIMQISTERRTTCAVTEKGKVYGSGEKFAKAIGMEIGSKFGFYELPIDG